MLNISRKSCSIFLLAALTLFSGCVIVKDVVPMSQKHDVQSVYIVMNQSVLMDGFLAELTEQISDLGIKPTVVATSAQVPSNEYYLTYTANWNWDLAMYLTYFEAKLKINNELIGYAKYDSRMGGASFDKFGPTADKIRPLIRQLFRK
ncbi:MAG: hypothetical protein JW942_09355 [Opitutales bacterium]|nr:hypothetical protein [Opitutales bacterium]